MPVRLFLLGAWFVLGQLYASPLVVERYVIAPPSGYFFENRPHERTQPIVVGDVVYFASLSGKVTAMHKEQGYALWTRQMPGGVEGALLYGRAKLFVGDKLGNLYALHTRDGSIAWEHKGKSEWLAAPAISRDTLFVSASDGGVYAFDEAKGTLKWFYPRSGDEKMTIRGVSSPVVFASDVYVGFADGTVAALSAESGRERWVKRLAQKERFYDIDTTPYVDEDHVVVGSYDGSIHCLDRTRGDSKWVFRVGSYAGFYVDAGRIYFAGLNGNYYALSLSTGSVVWNTPFGKGVGSRPVRVGDYLVFNNSADPTHLVEISSGKIVWQNSLGAGTMAAAAADPDGWFFCLSNYGNLYAYQIIGKRPEWTSYRGKVKSPSALHRNFGKL